MADQPITKAESVLAGQASMIGSSPLLAGLGSEGMDMGREKNREAPEAPRGNKWSFPDRLGLLHRIQANSQQHNS
jgi:hypothetical protein